MKTNNNRRKFIKLSLSAAAGLAATGLPQELNANPSENFNIFNIGTAQTPSIKFSVIGLNHGHIYSQVEAVIRGGGQLNAFYAKEADLAAAFAKRYPQAKQATTENEILEDNSIQLVLSASIPVERATRHSGDEPRERFYDRQTRHHHAGATR
jgi:hypothetical protein